MPRTFEDLVDEAARAPIVGWDFSWLDGRALEERPSWHYFDRVAERAARAEALLDLQTGAGAMPAALPRLPPLTVGTEGFAPNVALAAAALSRRGAYLIHTDEDRPALPLADASFDLVTSRHPVRTWWDDIARVLRPGGSYLSQQVGPRSLRSLSELLMGPLPSSSEREPDLAVARAEQAGLEVVDLRVEQPRTAFFDVGAVIYFLRLVVWIVPDFSVERYQSQLHRLHDHITQHGAFETAAARFLIEARRPG